MNSLDGLTDCDKSKLPKPIYCDKHSGSIMPRRGRCNSSRCNRRRVHGWVGYVKIQSLYCQEHTCQGPRNAHGFCSRERDPSYKFCSEHGKCQVPHCPRHAPRNISADDYPWTCPQGENIIMECFRSVSVLYRSQGTYTNSTVAINQQTANLREFVNTRRTKWNAEG